MSEETILDRIVRHKRSEVAARRAGRSESDLERSIRSLPPARGFVDRLTQHSPGVIAEIKRASPSQGRISENFDPTRIADDYSRHGAACLSVLTDERFFEGSDQHLVEARAACSLPVLRKDFVIDTYQVLETRAMGADCVLLIVSALESKTLKELHATALDCGLDVLIEVHDRQQLEMALDCQPRMIGINNRNLATFETSIQTTIDLVQFVPEGIVTVSESGIRTREDVETLQACGVDAFLVGESLMRSSRPGEKLEQIFSDGAASTRDS